MQNSRITPLSRPAEHTPPASPLWLMIPSLLPSCQCRAGPIAFILVASRALWELLTTCKRDCRASSSALCSLLFALCSFVPSSTCCPAPPIVHLHAMAHTARRTQLALIFAALFGALRVAATNYCALTGTCLYLSEHALLEQMAHSTDEPISSLQNRKMDGEIARYCTGAMHLD